LLSQAALPSRQFRVDGRNPRLVPLPRAAGGLAVTGQTLLEYMPLAADAGASAGSGAALAGPGSAAGMAAFSPSGLHLAGFTPQPPATPAPGADTPTLRPRSRLVGTAEEGEEERNSGEETASSEEEGRRPGSRQRVGGAGGVSGADGELEGFLSPSGAAGSGGGGGGGGSGGGRLQLAMPGRESRLLVQSDTEDSDISDDSDDERQGLPAVAPTPPAEAPTGRPVPRLGVLGRQGAATMAELAVASEPV
jgi:hypothetical protein